MKICSIEDCGKSAIKRGWCNMHYLRWWKNGDQNGGGRRYSTPEESFLSRTKKRITDASNGPAATPAPATELSA